MVVVLLLVEEVGGDCCGAVLMKEPAKIVGEGL